MSKSAIAVILSVLASYVLSCSNSTTTFSPVDRAPDPPATSGQLRLPAPSELRTVSSTTTDHVLRGSDFIVMPEFPRNQVTADSNSAVYTPHYHETMGLTLDAVAYATYMFNLGEACTASTLAITLDAVGSPTDAFIALANFSTDSWDWHALGVANEIEFDIEANRSPDGNLLAVPAFTGTDIWRIRQLQIGDLGQEAVVDGQVDLEDGANPWPDTYIEFIGNGLTSALVGSDGGWKKVLANGTYIVRPVNVGYDFTPPSVELVVNGNRLTLEPFNGVVGVPYMLDGYVYQSDGSTPMADIYVTVGGDAGYTVVTDADGYWQIEGIFNGHYTVHAWDEVWAFAPTVQDIVVAGEDITLDPITAVPDVLRSIEGIVYESDGTTPVSGVSLTLSGMGYWQTVTDATGHYMFEGRRRGRYLLEASLIGHEFVPNNQYVTVSDSDTTATPFIRYSVGAYTVDGYVFKSDGITPLADVEVTIWGWGYHSVFTDELGHWSVDGVVSGSYQVNPVKLPWNFTPANHEFVVQGTNVRVAPFAGELQPAHTVSGYVRNSETGDPIPDHAVRFTGIGTHDLFTDENGFYSIELPDGDWSVGVSGACWLFKINSQRFTVDGAPLEIETFLGIPWY